MDMCADRKLDCQFVRIALRADRAPLDARCSTELGGFIRSPVRWRSGTAREQ
jgi:hypothetical protein